MSEPTRITPIGLIGDGAGAPLNLSSYAIVAPADARDIPVVLVAGTSMNAGKTYTSASLIKGLSRDGISVAGIKATGTGSGGDVWLMADMGADCVLDFTDAGLASTYLADLETIERVVVDLTRQAAASGCAVAVVEIADGLHHEETAQVLQSTRIKKLSRGLIFAANDALGAQAGLSQLADWGHNVLALSGQLTRSPLAMREAERFAAVPVLTADEIRGGALNSQIMDSRSGEVVSFARKPRMKIGAEIAANAVQAAVVQGAAAR